MHLVRRHLECKAEPHCDYITVRDLYVIGFTVLKIYGKAENK